MDAGEHVITNAYMICTDGFNTVYCLIENVLCELERAEIPEWVETVYGDLNDEMGT